MYLWRRRATPRWLIANEEELRTRYNCNLAVIKRASRKRWQVEITFRLRRELQDLPKKFGGTIERLPRNWLERFTRQSKIKPLKVGGRPLIIPAGGAFGTGEHATTHLSLSMLQRVMRPRKKETSLLVDLGTGTGILALAAKRLGAKRVIALDYDSMAISIAKENARRNRIRGVKFQVADVRRWKFPGKIDIVTANLFSELLIAIVPKLKHSRRLILSGILRNQERGVRRALEANQIAVADIRRRGKWVALLAIRRASG